MWNCPVWDRKNDTPSAAGLRRDGTLVSVGVNGAGQCSVDSLML